MSLAQLLQPTVEKVLTGLLTTGILMLGADLVLTRRNNRILTGEESIPEDNGLIGMVHENREAHIRAGTLPLTDGGKWIGNTEAESDRDGFLSTRPELHALAIGFVAGVLLVLTREPAVATSFAAVLFGARRFQGHLGDVRKEAGYAALGFLLALPLLLWDGGL